ncbi:hypothetical protein [Nitrincola sp. MINF-07-Sa-05]|uniref:hypothetical protein n=1 Tax=Nitrincola salilacus TaxID=3400273 RepID=UPI00391834AA
MNLIKTLPLTLILFCSQAIAYQGEIDKFFSLYESGKVTEAVDSIYSTNKWLDRKSDDVEKVKSQLSNINNLVGEYYGKTKLGVSDIEDRLIYVSYLALYERQPIRMEFVFYRPEEKWIIYSFSFDDNIDNELIDAARSKIAGYK